MPRMERLMAILSLMTLTLSGCAFITLDLKSLMRPTSMEERVIRKGSKDKVLVVEILGPITTTAARDTFMPRQGTLERLDTVFARAKNDTNIKGIILRIDSPGGGVTSSDLVYRKIMEYKGSQRIPVMACITNLGASGAYMVALAADRIIALPTSTVGNVGVLLPSLSFEGLLDTLGIRNQTLTSGKYKDAGSPFRDMSAEEKAIYNDIVMDFYRNFIDKVKQHRPVTEEDLKIVGDGRIMTASAALKYHLIDEIGYYETALKAVETSANIQNPTVIIYRREGENTGGFYSWP
jgi:protease IV